MKFIKKEAGWYVNEENNISIYRDTKKERSSSIPGASYVYGWNLIIGRGPNRRRVEGLSTLRQAKEIAHENI